MLDWTDPNAYLFTVGLTAGQWAWEFLRRNPRYRKEWSEFMANWRALEATYGKPSKRDVQAWKQDPRAWVPAAECQSSDCRVDANKVLIECAMGARWGFYKFPPDPLDADPVGEGGLVWREVETEACLVSGEEAREEVSKGTALVCFELGLPLHDQLLSAKRRLQIEQRKRIKSGLLLPPRIAAHHQILCRKLRLLDAIEAGAGEPQIKQQLFSGVDEGFAEKRKSALELRERGYRRLLLLE